MAIALIGAGPLLCPVALGAATIFFSTAAVVAVLVAPFALVAPAWDGFAVVAAGAFELTGAGFLAGLAAGFVTVLAAVFRADGADFARTLGPAPLAAGRAFNAALDVFLAGFLAGALAGTLAAGRFTALLGFTVFAVLAAGFLAFAALGFRFFTAMEYSRPGIELSAGL